uniref:Uncharacterized protein n=1 Tax=Oryza sativa subsp. japonica TaxID=39947 RepID=Q2QUE0_ORYSJ|nr:hypothetical protein LOC_Os12g16570 [Oryza sativa Japonica Group]
MARGRRRQASLALGGERRRGKGNIVQDGIPAKPSLLGMAGMAFGAKTPLAKTITGEELALRLQRSIIAGGPHKRRLQSSQAAMNVRLRRSIFAGVAYVVRLR